MEQFQKLIKIQEDAAGTSADVVLEQAPELPTKEVRSRKANLHSEHDEEGEADFFAWQEAQVYKEAWEEAARGIDARQPPSPCLDPPDDEFGINDDDEDDEAAWVHSDQYSTPNGDA